MITLRSSLGLALTIIVALASGVACADDERWLEGRWRIVRGIPAPWVAADRAVQADVATLAGQIVVFEPDHVQGPAILGCANARYAYGDWPADALFQGNLPAPAAQAAAALGMTGATIPSVDLRCDHGLFALHRATPEAAMLALDNVIWILDRAPGAFAAEDAPEFAVQRLLETHLRGEMSFVPTAVVNKTPWLSRELQARIASYFAQPFAPDEVPPINGDAFTDSQEYPTLFAVRPARIEGDGADVPVRFDDGYRARVVVYRLRRDGDQWRVDDLVYDHGATFRDALAPLADGAAAER